MTTHGNMAGMLPVDNELDDRRITECFLCAEEFTDPRVLPCIHTFCLKCLLNYAKDRHSGDRVPCPLCGIQFTVPDSGLPVMKKDFFMKKVLRVSKLLHRKEADITLYDVRSDVIQELISLTECPVCREFFTSPRVLTCLHTFCLECLLNCDKNRRSRKSRMPCPLCRKEFTIPHDGLSGTQKNFNMEKLICLTVRLMPNAPKVRHVKLGGYGVAALASLGDDVFVVRWSSQQHIEVYDVETLTSRGDIAVPGLSYSLGLAACPNNNCLYASDRNSDSVHRVDLSDRNAVMKWSVASCPVGLSVNHEDKLVVVSQGERKLQIFTTRGVLLQNIELQAYTGIPWQAIQLSPRQFLVSHLGSLHRVSSVGVGGTVFRSYGAGPAGPDLTQMNNPRGIAVDGEGRVLVADDWNNRLLVLDPSLTGARKMTIYVPSDLKTFMSVKGSLQAPFSLWYDQSRRRLFVGESAGKVGRLIVIDNLEDFSALHV